MAEVLTRFRGTLATSGGVHYRAQACGAPSTEGTWIGETTQPNRRNAVYWATGLTQVYLEGALERALDRPIAVRPAPALPAFDAPATFGPAAPPWRAGRLNHPTEAVLDPYSAYERGEAHLRRQLGALSTWHLINVIVACELSTLTRTELNALRPAALIDLIVSAVAAS